MNGILKTTALQGRSARGDLASRTRWLVTRAVSLWLSATTIWYARTAVVTVRHPFNVGADVTWAWAWLAFVGGAALFGLLLPRLMHIVSLIGLASAGAAIVLLSGQLPAVLITVWLLALAWVCAAWLLERIGVGPPGISLEGAAIGLPLGLALLAFLGLALGLARGLSTKWSYLLLLLVTVARWRDLWGVITRLRHLAASEFTRPAGRGGTGRRVLITLLGFAFLLNLAWALAPEVQYDALNYHLSVPKIYVAEHRVVDLPYFWHSYFARSMNMLFALGISLRGQTVAKLLTLTAGVIAAIGTYSLGCRLFNPRVGAWAAALFYSAPLVSWLSSTAYTDLPLTMCLPASLLAFLRWREGEKVGWLWVSGILAGAGVGIKLTACYAIPAIGLALIYDLLRTRQLSARAKVAGVVGYAAGLGLMALPWYALTYAFTGNPFFPMFNAVFKSPGWPAVNTNFNAGSFGLGNSPTALLSLPFAATFESLKFGEALPRGGLGISLALLPIGLILLASRRASVKLLLAICLAYFGIWASTMQYGRYYIPLLPFVLVVVVGAIVTFSRPPWVRFLNSTSLSIALIAQVVVTPVLFWNIPERVPVRLVFGLESPGDFLTRALPAYPAAQHINSIVEPGEKVIGVNFDNLRFYLDTPLVSPAESPSLLQGMGAVPLPELAGRLIKEGYTYLLVNHQDLDSRRTYQFLSPAFLDKFATLKFSRNGVRVYRLGEQAKTADLLAASNLLANAGFEALDATGQPTGWWPYGRPHITRSKAQAHTGEVVVGAGTGDGLTQPVKTFSGRNYSLGHFTRSDLPNQFARVQINWLDDRGQIVDVSIEVVEVGPVWQWHQLTVTAPARSVTAVIYVSVHEHSRVWFDDFQFIEQ
jgi:4-amino-4-deoxy-L-arabinose transferase-like glycosyltransferase